MVTSVLFFFHLFNPNPMRYAAYIFLNLFFGLATIGLLFCLPAMHDMAQPTDKFLLPFMALLLACASAYLCVAFGRLAKARYQQIQDRRARAVLARVRINRQLKAVSKYYVCAN